MSRVLTLQMRRRTRPQKAIFNSQARFNVAAWGRQSGKTTFGIDKMLVKPLQGRTGGVYWFIEPTFTGAQIAFNRMWDLIRPAQHLLLGAIPNKTELLIPLVGNRKIFFKSGEVFENLRMETLDGCIIDEYRQQRPELWGRVIRPMLAKRKGWCDFLSTTNGFEHFYDLFEMAKANTRGEWATFHAPSSEAWWWTPEELASARASTSQAEYEQEYEAKFHNIHVGKAYSSEGDWNRRPFSPFSSRNELVSKYLPITVGLDFNVNPMSLHLCQFRNESSYWFDEIHIENTNTQECATELVERLVKLRSQGLLTQSHPQVQLVGDATGESRSTKATQSDYDIICQALEGAGISWTNLTPKSNPPVKQRVNTMNARLRNANGDTTFYYNPVTCPWLKRDFDRVSWKMGAESLLDQVTDRSLTHASDSVGYPVCVLAPIELYGSVGKLHVIPNRA